MLLLTILRLRHGFTLDSFIPKAFEKPTKQKRCSAATVTLLLINLCYFVILFQHFSTHQGPIRDILPREVSNNEIQQFVRIF